MSDEINNEIKGLTPAQLVTYIKEMTARIDRVGDRLLAYAESQERVTLQEKIDDGPISNG